MLRIAEGEFRIADCGLGIGDYGFGIGAIDAGHLPALMAV